jgi:hypothetical protein
MVNRDNVLINKAIKRYNYNEKIEIDRDKDGFLRSYKNFTDKDTLKKYTHIIYGVLEGIPYSTHIVAKNLLFQEDENCWKYFERTALFWTMSHINDPFIDHIKAALEYSLYLERNDLIEILLKKAEEYLNRDEYKTNKDYKNQKVYPSTQLIHFLLEKWLGKNPIKDRVLQYGSGYGIYQRLIDNWDDLSKIESTYWDELCEYHLKGLSLEKEDDYKTEEFLASGLVPMELINIIKVRKKLGLDTPVITHELFKTPMAKEPQIPTGYKDDLDVKYQLVKKAVDTKKKWTIDEIVSELKSQFGEDVDLFL